MAARRKSRRRRQRARQTQETRPMGNGWKRNDAMRCDATRTPHGARSPNVVRLSAPVSAAKQPGRAAPQRPLIQPHSGHPVGGPALGARGGRETGARDGRETKEGFQFAAWGLGEWGGGMIPMIGELVPPDCIIRCLKWLAPLPLLCFLGRRATTTRPQFDMAIDRPRLPSTNTARSGRDLGRGRGRGRGYTQSTWNL